MRRSAVAQVADGEASGGSIWARLKGARPNSLEGCARGGNQSGWARSTIRTKKLAPKGAASSLKSYFG